MRPMDRTGHDIVAEQAAGLLGHVPRRSVIVPMVSQRCHNSVGNSLRDHIIDGWHGLGRVREAPGAWSSVFVPHVAQ